MQSTGILVAGMHRSGTSATTGALGMLGVKLGQKMLQPDANNRKGYWEHARAAAIHERLLAGLERRWDDVRPLPEGWLESDPAKAAKAELKLLIAEEFSIEPLWAVKDPRICRLMPLWLDVLTDMSVNPVVLFVVRRPSEVAASIEARDGWPGWVGTALWLRHVLEAEQASRHLSRTVLLYEDLIASPLAALSAALARLGITSAAGCDAEGVHGFVDASERHHWHHQVGAFSPDSSLQAIAHRAYEALALAARDAAGWRRLESCSESAQRVWDDGAAGYEGLAVMAARLGNAERMQRTEVARLKRELVERDKRLSEAMAESRAASALVAAQSDGERLALQKELELLRDQEKRMAERVEAAESQNKAAQVVQVELRSEIDTLSRRLLEREAHQRVLEADVVQLREQCSNLELLVEDAERTQQRLAAERDRLESELKISLEASKTQAHALNMMSDARDGLRRSVASMERKVESARVALAEARSVDEEKSESLANARRLLAEAVHQRDEAIERGKQHAERLETLIAEHGRLLLMLNDTEAELLAMRSSKSWRITEPLRALTRAVRPS